ncbi:ATP-binding cassette domain-containing protein [Mycoplasma sp. Pen4]|uniref:Mbov_0121 family peptidase domain-containing ABC transporter n=1 Tax=Mycoplasma sp. Pen4 TaxID=640330 RepID=UPI0016547CD1|nr:cysteine peptidase family C39 domain-containing protein [Mycoplasma sp. Pen4]QNM93506.1 ATP-binding cassette domain-containing protein [Mycoplasma sp. Pen4]
MKEIQYDQRDCSLYVLRYFINFLHSKKIGINELKQSAVYTKSGIKLSELSKIALNFNIKLDTYSCSFDQLKNLDNSIFPIAIIVNQNNLQHIVIVEKVKNNIFYLYDPAKGNITLSNDELTKIYANILVSFTKTKSLENTKINDKKSINFSIYQFDKFSALYLISLLIETTIMFIFPYFNKLVLNSIVPNKLSYHLMYLAVIVGIIICISFLIKVISSKLLEKILILKQQNFINHFISIMKINNHKLINNLTVGEAKNRISAINMICNLQVTFLPDIISSILTFGLAIYLLWHINTILLLAILIYSILNFIITLLVKNNYTKHFSRIIEANLSFEESFSNFFEYSKLSGNYDLECKIQQNTINKYLELNNEMMQFKMKNIALHSVLATLDLIAPLLILFIGAYQIWQNQLTIVNLIFFLTGASLFTKPIKSMIGIYENYYEFSKYSKLLTIFNLEQLVLSNNNFFEKVKTIEFKNCRYSYASNAKNFVINLPNIKFEKHSRLNGSNGCGKTTISAIISGNKQIDEGEILINKIKINPFINPKFKERVLYLGNKNVLTNIRIIDFLNLNNIDELMKIVEKLDLLDHLNAINLNITEFTNINELSNGQYQLINILNIFIKDYDAVIFDEAFENIDPNIFSKIKPFIQENLSNNLTIEISHNQKYIFQDSKVINIEK